MIKINSKLEKDISEYCKLNSLNISDFVNKILKKAFLIEKYGDKPQLGGKTTDEPKKVSKFEFHLPDKEEDEVISSIDEEQDVIEIKKPDKRRKLK